MFTHHKISKRPESGWAFHRSMTPIDLTCWNSGKVLDRSIVRSQRDWRWDDIPVDFDLRATEPSGVAQTEWLL